MVTPPPTTVKKPITSAGLKGKRDRYGGIHVVVDQHSVVAKFSVDQFAGTLKECLTRWKKEGARAVWLKFPVSLARFAGPAVEHGFQPHHARPDSGFVFTLWLGKGESKLPLYAHHTIGAAGVVLSRRDDGELLVLAIRERHGPTATLKDFWKLPGGAVDPKENIQQAAIREVLEETGIKAEFVSMLAFRETHGALHNVTDLYCVCHLHAPLDPQGNPQLPVPCADEIAQAEWIPVSTFLNSKYYTKDNAYGRLLHEGIAVAIKNLESKSAEPHGLITQKLPSFGAKVDTIYYLNHHHRPPLYSKL